MAAQQVPRPTQAHNIDHANAVAFGLAAAAIAAACPASLVGGAAAYAGWSVTRPPIVTRWLIAGLGFVTAAALRGRLVLGWPWRLLAHVAAPQLVGGVAAASIVRSLPAELLLGPLALLLFETATTLWRRTIHGQE